MQIARREELEFIDKLGVSQEVCVVQCWLDANTKPVGEKWVDINKGDGERVAIRIRHRSTELKVYRVKMRILRDDVFSAIRILGSFSTPDEL